MKKVQIYALPYIELNHIISTLVGHYTYIIHIFMTICIVMYFVLHLLSFNEFNFWITNFK